MARLAKALSAAAGSAGGGKVYVEDVFSTSLYVSDGNDRTITNNIDLSGEGGLVWIKFRDTALGSGNNALFDTARGVNKVVYSNTTGAEATLSEGVEAFNANGFDLGNYNSENGSCNYNTARYASYSFRKQEGFFDIVTWTGNSTASRAISHGLNAKVGAILVKCTSDARPWPVYHSSVPTGYGYLNSTGKFFSGSGNGVFGDASYNNIAPTTSVFYVGSDSEVNGTGKTYIAYVFAEGTDSGSQIFGDDDEAIIKCGSYQSTGNADEVFVDLGFEPQWIMIKNSSDASGQNWLMQDTMRGMAQPSTTNNPYLLANTSGAENSVGTAGWARAEASGVTIGVAGAINMFNSVQTYTYIAIRRGPMKEPDAGTDVFNGVLTNSNNSTTTGFPVDIGFPVDLAFIGYTAWGTQITMNRLMGLTSNPQPGKGSLSTYTNAAQANSGELWGADNNTGFRIYGHNYPRICYGWRRYPKAFDIVHYTGNSSVAVNHNLTVPPELIITKEHAHAWDWYSWGSVLGANKFVTLNSNAAATNNTFNSTVTATTFMAGIASSGQPTVAFLFATLAGVSKVGSVVHSGTTNVDCGFSGGARFVMVKRTDSAGDWYYWDTIRGIAAGNDPYLRINQGAGEVTNTDYIDPLASGFTLTSSFTAGTYIFLAFA